MHVTSDAMVVVEKGNMVGALLYCISVVRRAAQMLHPVTPVSNTTFIFTFTPCANLNASAGRVLSLLGPHRSTQ